MRSYGYVVIALFLAIFLVASVSALEFRVIPEKDHWVADGVTPYKLYVYLDGAGVGHVGFAQWRLTNPHPSELQYVSRSLPTSNDFFEGVQMLSGFNYVAEPGDLSGRVVKVYSQGPVDHTGYVGEYVFTVPVGTAPGTYYFNIGDLVIGAEGIGYYPGFVIEPVHVVAPGTPLFSSSTLLPTRKVKSSTCFNC